MDFLLYFVMSIVLCTLFSRIWKAVASFCTEVTTQVVADIREQKLIDEPVLFIEEFALDNIHTFLVYNATTKDFICQGTTVDEIANGIRRVFATKQRVWLIKDEDQTVVPMNIVNNT